MPQTKPQLSLERLIAGIKSQRQHKPGPKPKQTPEDVLANKLAAKIADELLWVPHRLVMLTTHQHCACGQDFRAVMGLYLESKHKKNHARRLRQTNRADLKSIDHLPHGYEELNEAIAICPHCLLERDVVDALMNPIHEATVQLPLFDHALQQRVCT